MQQPKSPKHDKRFLSMLLKVFDLIYISLAILDHFPSIYNLSSEYYKLYIVYVEKNMISFSFIHILH